MATYLKRTSKLFDFSLSRASGDVSLRDLMCPVCRGILIEPVTLPCTHNLCLRCLKGTFEHNSLSCPLCRVRVGSWLRTATKSETLVNVGLWEFIRAKFPKEVEDKYNGDERDIDLDTGYTASKILSAAGEIRQEYEAQLERAEEERRCQIEAEQMASEVLIRKLQAEEEQQQLMLLAQDQLFAKTLAKKQVTDKQNDGSTNYGKFPNAPLSHCSLESKSYVNTRVDVGASKVEQESDNGKINLLELREASELRRPNIALISKIRAERYASSMKVNANNVQKDSPVKFCCQKAMPVYNAVTKTLTQQPAKVVQPCTSNYITEPGPSVSKIYGQQSKEELHVPNDVVSNKKKSLGIEVCVTSSEGDARIGSAESAGSHDSINQEIHHFKPIKAIPRTPLKLSTDGRQIDPKLIRVMPILKRIYNAVPKPPSQTHFKRIIGCSWSAFRGKTKQNSKDKEVLQKSAELIDLEQKASTSCGEVQVSEDTLSKLCDNQRVDFVSDVSYDTNKNYTKGENKMVNGVKVGKRLSLEGQTGIDKSPQKGGPRKTHVKNGMIGKSKRQKNYGSKKGARSVVDDKDTENIDTRVSISPETLSKFPEDDEDNECEIVTRAADTTERRRRQRSQVPKKNMEEVDALSRNSEPNNRRTTRKRAGELTETSITHENILKLEKSNKIAVGKPKRRKMSRSTKNSTESSSSSVDIFKSENETAPATSSLRKSARNANQSKTQANNRENFLDQCVAQMKDLSKSSPHISDEYAIKDQERIEQLLRQEQEDFELAQRLQAKFDEMTRIAGRTRQSRRVVGSPDFELDLWRLDINRTASKSTSATSSVSRPIDNQTVDTEVKKRGRPLKRVK